MTTSITPSQCVALASVISMTQGHGKVCRVIDGVVYYGHARYLTGKDGAVRPDDVTQCYLRVTLNSGFEVFWPLVELALETYHGLFVSRDWTPDEARSQS